jgi:succinoglycan biosynthesis protein ExoA
MLMLPAEDGVLVAVPVLNEEKHLDACIRGLLAQECDRPVTILILDGGSTDRTREIATALSAAHPQIKLVANPRRIQSAAINIAAASEFPGRILVRADAHADYRSDYIARCVEALETTGADSVVVSMRTVGLAPFQRAVAAAQNSLLGNGGSAHRRATTSRFVDHGHHAAFRRDFFVSLGGYDESFTHNEDAEFDRRAALAGGRIWLCAEATITYYPRARIKDLSRQYYNYGRGRAQNMLRHRTLPKLRQVAPLIVSGSGLLGLAAAPFYPPAILVPLSLVLLYGGWSLVASVQRRDPAILAMGVAAAAMHLSWSAGFVAMMTRRRLRSA